MDKLAGDWLHFVVSASPEPAPALEFLLELGLPADRRDDNGATPLQLAAARGDAASVALLRARGAVPHEGESPAPSPAREDKTQAPDVSGTFPGALPEASPAAGAPAADRPDSPPREPARPLRAPPTDSSG